MNDAGDIQYEVEQKFWVSAPEAVERRLRELGARFGPRVMQMDYYFRHPARDFAATDEAFRLRCVGEANWLTYKGPKVDTSTKTRREIEFAIASGAPAAQACRDLLAALGFTPAGEVHKTRTSATLPRDGETIVAAIDSVEGLGDFVELEMSAAAAEVDAARRLIAVLADDLGLVRNERRSYLDLLLNPPAKDT